MPKTDKAEHTLKCTKNTSKATEYKRLAQPKFIKFVAQHAGPPVDQRFYIYYLDRFI